MRDPANILRRLEQGLEIRRQREQQLRDEEQTPDHTESQLRSRLSQLQSDRDAQAEQAEAEYRTVRDRAEAVYVDQLGALETAHRAKRKEIETEAARALQQVEQQRGDSEWVVSSVLDDEAEDSPLREFERFRTVVEKSREEQAAELDAIAGLINSALERRGRGRREETPNSEPPRSREAAQTEFAESSAEVREQIRRLQSLWLPKLFRGLAPLILFSLLAAAIAVPVFYFVNPDAVVVGTPRMSPQWIGISFGAGVIGSLILSLVLYAIASMKESEVLRNSLAAEATARQAIQQWSRFTQEQLVRVRKDTEARQKKIVADRKRALARYERAHQERVEQIQNDRKNRLREEETTFTSTRDELIAQRDEQVRLIDEEFQHRSAEVAAAWQTALQQAEQELQSHVAVRAQHRRGLESQLLNDWQQSWSEFDDNVRSQRELDEARFPTWESLASGGWQPQSRIPESIRIGDFQLDLETYDGMISGDSRLDPDSREKELPCHLPFPSALSCLFRSPDARARETALQATQSILLRLLTQLPPGTLRMTILDPVGLGESFGGFMHLTDYDELLVTSRIWTEANQIEARLADLTEHMENVLQKYLRNEFETIEAYNESAGEVAEPYHILVISDFPAKFSEIAGRRLTSIINSGPRCGVYTIMNLDPSKPLPHNFTLEDVLPKMTRFDWDGDAFHVDAPLLSNWPIEMDTPPPPGEFTSIVRQVGDASRDSRRVEVSFDRVTPAAKDIWSHDSRYELVIPLGRAGATKLQQLRLGRGTSQHMLVAGKTGSGKSTFLHILITNLALHYSPDDVNFYLIDFKKGVEFKDYATFNLPHARVIAIESDREFGVSALQRLDAILQERGELFRRHQVQDIAGYRDVTGKALPRILLVVDEFQEFFVEDDRISQAASLLLDRLVRQGRAFGMHVILGSQTLGGAYSLARSTLGQVAVRVALQCSESDAHLILSEENTAARLLTRPGEAIYNDANGVVEGNHPFQIAWISDEQRENSLRQIQERMLRRGGDVEETVVFEGNIPSDLTRQRELSRLIDEYSQRESAIVHPTVWLGDAVEIGPSTSVRFTHHTGNNLLIVGTDSEAALGLLGAAYVALGASQGPHVEQPGIFVFDGSEPDSADEAGWNLLFETLPFAAERVSPRKAGEKLQQLTEELKRRENVEDLSKLPPVFVLVHHLARFRDLRKPDDDFGFSSFGSEEKPPATGQLFADLLSNGPQVGMHCLIWCDSYNNVDRWLSRQTLRELELRVLFQMNSSDSSNLIDSPVASRLGTHRALLYREETGASSKFRPFALPDAEWIESVRSRLEHGNDSDEMPDLEEFTIL